MKQEHGFCVNMQTEPTGASGKREETHKRDRSATVQLQDRSQQQETLGEEFV